MQRHLQLKEWPVKYREIGTTKSMITENKNIQKVIKCLNISVIECVEWLL